MPNDVFISYSNKDKVVADSIVAALETNGVRCWYAPRDIKPGTDWGDSIAKALGESRVFILVFSNHSNNSQRVLDELNLAISKELVILPFRIEKLDPSGAMLLHLSARHWLDAFDPSWERYINDLVKSVLSNLGKEGVEVKQANFQRVKARKVATRIITISLLLVLLISGGILGLPKLLDGGLARIVGPRVTISATSTTTPITTSTETESPTPEGPALGSTQNPIILMYVPPAGIDFAEISEIGDQITNEFSSENPGLTMKAIPASDKGSITQALCDGEAQVGFLGPFSYLIASEQGCAEVKLIWSRESNAITYGGMVIVNSDSNITQLEELSGKTLCIPADSVSGWVLPSLYIRASIGDPYQFFGKIVELDNHNMVMEDVYYGECDAGTTYFDARQNSSLPDVTDRLQIIFTTATIPNNNISFTSEIDRELSAILVNYFLNLSKTSDQFAEFNDIYNTNDSSRLIDINDYYYNQLRELLQSAGATPEEFLWSDR
jgi:phosphonate transport system substrate-binding protein